MRRFYMIKGAPLLSSFRRICRQLPVMLARAVPEGMRCTTELPGTYAAARIYKPSEIYCADRS
jgi:hypothetical protein